MNRTTSVWIRKMKNWEKDSRQTWVRSVRESMTTKLSSHSWNRKIKLWGKKSRNWKSPSMKNMKSKPAEEYPPWIKIWITWPDKMNNSKGDWNKPWENLSNLEELPKTWKETMRNWVEDSGKPHKQGEKEYPRMTIKYLSSLNNLNMLLKLLKPNPKILAELRFTSSNWQQSFSHMNKTWLSLTNPFNSMRLKWNNASNNMNRPFNS